MHLCRPLKGILYVLSWTAQQCFLQISLTICLVRILLFGTAWYRNGEGTWPPTSRLEEQEREGATKIRFNPSLKQLFFKCKLETLNPLRKDRVHDSSGSDGALSKSERLHFYHCLKTADESLLLLSSAPNKIPSARLQLMRKPLPSLSATHFPVCFYRILQYGENTDATSAYGSSTSIIYSIRQLLYNFRQAICLDMTDCSG